MTVDEWINRCAERFAYRGGLTWQQARSKAIECFDANADGDDFDTMADYDPEAAADLEMDCWEPNEWVRHDK